MSVATEEKRDLTAAALSHRGDRVFNRIITGCAFTALVVLAGITVFLGAQAFPVLKDQGIHFLTTTAWDSYGTPPVYGIAGMLWGSLLLSVVALVIAVPVSLLLSVFLVFLAPKPVSKILTNLIDLMAAIPSSGRRSSTSTSAGSRCSTATETSSAAPSRRVSFLPS